MHINVACCICEKDACLMVQEAKGQAFGLWNFPSGKLEPCEDIFVGAIRECKEETGYDICLTGLLAVHNFMRIENPLVRIIFSARIISGEICYNQSEILQVKWIPIIELKQMRNEIRGYPSALDVISAVCNKVIYPLEIIKNIDFQDYPKMEVS